MQARVPSFGRARTAHWDAEPGHDHGRGCYLSQTERIPCKNSGTGASAELSPPPTRNDRSTVLNDPVFQ